MKFNSNIFTETQKNALFAFGEPDKTATCCNLVIASSMCEGELTAIILMELVYQIEEAGITEEEFSQLVQEIRSEIYDNVEIMECEYKEKYRKPSAELHWKGFAQKKILSAFGNESCGETVVRLRYVEHVTTDPEIKEIVHELADKVAGMNTFYPEKYDALLKEARKVDELWRLKATDVGFPPVLEHISLR